MNEGDPNDETIYAILVRAAILQPSTIFDIPFVLFLCHFLTTVTRYYFSSHDEMSDGKNTKAKQTKKHCSLPTRRFCLTMAFTFCERVPPPKPPPSELIEL